MTEVEWLACEVAFQPLIYAREVASVRRLRLIAAAYATWLQTLPHYQADAKPCADLIERMADAPVPWREFEGELYARPGGWQLSHTLGPDDRVGQNLNKMVWFAEQEFEARNENPQIAHVQLRAILHEVVGNPFHPVAFDPAWRTDAVVGLARTIYECRAFDWLPVLADALEDAGCADAAVLAHCRGPGPHVRGCWVVDLVLGKT